jgi:hypothetical protein
MLISELKTKVSRGLDVGLTNHDLCRLLVIIDASNNKESMTQSERFEYIRKLEAENRELKLTRDLARAKQETRQDTVNTGVSIIITQMSIANAMLWWGKS